jgi:hypothetical protein
MVDGTLPSGVIEAVEDARTRGRAGKGTWQTLLRGESSMASIVVLLLNLGRELLGSIPQLDWDNKFEGRF